MASRPSKKRRLTPPSDDDSGESHSKNVQIQKSFFKSASSWHLEQDYEKRPRKGKKKEKDTGRLPIKTLDGRIEQLQDDDGVDSVASDAEWLQSESEGEEIPTEEPARVAETPQIPEREQVRIAQEELSKIAAHLNEDPEEHPGAFKAMAKIGESKSMAVKKLYLVTAMVVYKDTIPGYRIRPASEDASGEKLSKEVRKLRAYETALVSGYQAYIKTLAHFAFSRDSGASKSARTMATIAITCACTLLNAVPHFNFRTDLIKILVRKLSMHKVDESFIKCRQCLEVLFQEDEEGRPSMEAVSLLAKMMKARDYKVHECILNLFLHLRLLSEISGQGSINGVDRPNEESEQGKRRKKDRDFLTKRERKKLKEQKAAEKVMAAADATVSYEERDQMQSEMLKMVFATYFRILKQRSPHLMGAVLEGLSRYAHLINQDFFGDLLEALKDLIRSSNLADGPDEDEEDDEDFDNLSAVRDTNREALLCTVTAFTLLAGQDAHNSRSNLHLDLTFFMTNLYQSLLSLSVNPDLELGAKSLHLPDPDNPMSGADQDKKVNLQTTTVLLLRCLQGVLLPPWNIRSVPPLRLAAFTKQLMTTSLQMPEKSCQAVLGLLDDVVHTHGRKINALWNTEERKGDGTFNPLSDSVEGSNPFTTSIWEGEILRKHYCPKVRDGLKILEKKIASI